MKSGHLVDRAPRALGFAWARRIVPVGVMLRAEIVGRDLAEPALAYRLFARDLRGVGCMVQRWFRLDTPRPWIARQLLQARRELRAAVAAMNRVYQ